MMAVGPEESLMSFLPAASGCESGIYLEGDQQAGPCGHPPRGRFHWDSPMNVAAIGDADAAEIHVFGGYPFAPPPKHASACEDPRFARTALADC